MDSLPDSLVSTKWLSDHLEDPDLRILDCTAYLPNFGSPSSEERIEVLSGREHWEKGHIPGSGFADLTTDFCGPSDPGYMFPLPDEARMTEGLARLGVRNDTPLVLYDDMSHFWAARFWWLLRLFGFGNVAILDGGWKKWVMERHPVSREPVEFSSGDVTLAFHPESVASKEEVQQAIRENGYCLINALEPVDFRGRGFNRFGRLGHIPASVNLPATDWIDPKTQAFLPVDELEELAVRPEILRKKRILVYCGGAIAASTTAFVLTRLGARNVAVYEGSLTEWAADPDLPLKVMSS